MKSRNLLIEASISALILGGLGLAQPAWAQSTEAKTSDDAAADKPAKAKDKKDKSDDAVTDIIVTARRKALNDAIEIKRNSDTIVDSVVADQAGKLPDTSITEVLQRVSGVTLSRFSADQGNPSFQIEGTGISVRGLPFNSSMLNGRQVFSANGASAISWGDVTPELMSAVDVYKGSLATLIEGGASAVDLRTRLPFDYSKPEIDLTVGGSYGDMARKFSPSASVLFTKKWDTSIGEFGVLYDFAFSRYDSQSSDLAIRPFYAEYAPGSPYVATVPDGAGGTVKVPNVGLIPYGYNWSNSSFKRDRYGAYQALQWRPNPNLTFTNTVFYSQYVQDSQVAQAGFGTSPQQNAVYIPVNPTFDSNGAMIAGSLRYGATGQIVYGTPGNTWLQQYSPGWSPAPTTDCGSQAGYGGPVSQTTADWANGIYGCTAPLDNIQGFTGSRSVSHSKSSTLDISQTFLWTPGDKVRVRGGLQYVSSQAKSKSLYASIVQEANNLASASFDLRKSIPVVGGFDAAALADTTAAYWSTLANHGIDNKGHMFAANVDVDYDFGSDSFFRSVSVGARASVRNESDVDTGTYWAPLAQPWAGIKYYLSGDNTPTHTVAPDGSPNDYQLYNFPQYFGGRVPSPGAVLMPSESVMKNYDWYHLLSTYGQRIPGGTPQDYYNAHLLNTNGPVNTRIKNYAGYIQLKFGHDNMGIIPRFSGSIGVRFVAAEIHSSGQLSQNQITNFFLSQAAADAYIQAQLAGGTGDPSTIYSSPSSSTPRSLDYSFFRVLPAFNIKFDVTPNFVMRAAAAEAVSPPNLNDVRAGGSIGANTLNYSVTPPGGGTPISFPYLTNFSITAAGARLKPTMIRSEDLSLEWYPRNGSMVYLSLFAKQIKDQPIFTSFVQNQPTPLVDGNNQVSMHDLPWTYLQNETSTKGVNIKGFEVGARTFFDKLPGLLSGFGINGSFTFVDSTNPGPKATDVLGNDIKGLPFFNLSKYSYNAELLYSRGRVNMRLAYNWRSKQLLSTNVNPLSWATSGGNPYNVILSPTDFSSTYNFQVYNMVPLWAKAAGYVDFSFDFKINDRFVLNTSVGNLLNTKSKTVQEPLAGVFLPYDTNMSDRRINATLRAKF